MQMFLSSLFSFKVDRDDFKGGKENYKANKIKHSHWFILK